MRRDRAEVGLLEDEDDLQVVSTIVRKWKAEGKVRGEFKKAAEEKRIEEVGGRTWWSTFEQQNAS